jgi:hypothetical protein
VDPDLNHDMCASIFNAVGIYMLLDVNSPLAGESIDRTAPWTSYDSSYLNRTFAVVEAFKNFPNTLLYFAGNEVINEMSDISVPQYMRAVTRDLKNYIAKNSDRAIPVGYSAADVRPMLLDTWNYMQCQTTDNDPSRVDLFALNSYSWCGDSNFQTSGYDVLVSDFAKTSVPVFFSEYGCNVPYPRVFTEVPVLYGPLVTPVLSGGLVYEYSQETSNYGLVNLNTDGSAQLLGDFATLQTQFNSLNITALQGLTAQNTTVTPPTCDASLISNSTFDSNFTMPDVPPGAQALIDNGITGKNNGKLVSVTATKVTQIVENASGTTMSDLAITPLASDESNNPGHTTSSTGSATSSAATPSSTKKGAATNLQGNSKAMVAMVVLVMGCISLF